MRAAMRPAMPLLASLFGLVMCSEPAVLRAPLPEPTTRLSFDGDRKVPLPALAVPTGEPPVMWEPTGNRADPQTDLPIPLTPP